MRLGGGLGTPCEQFVVEVGYFGPWWLWVYGDPFVACLHSLHSHSCILSFRSLYVSASLPGCPLSLSLSESTISQRFFLPVPEN